MITSNAGHALLTGIAPPDNAMITLGLASCGFKQAVQRIFPYCSYGLLLGTPALARIVLRLHAPCNAPTMYPVACALQAWARAAVALMQASLGLQFDPETLEIQFEHPILSKVVGDAKLQSDGKAERTAGKIQNAVGGTKDTVREIVKK